MPKSPAERKAPQSPGSEPATVPGKWIPVSEQMPEENGVKFCPKCGKSVAVSSTEGTEE